MSGIAKPSLKRRGAIASVVLLIAFLAAWQWGPGLLGIPPFIVPPLSTVANEAVRMWHVNGLLFHTGITSAEVIIGFILVFLIFIAFIFFFVFVFLIFLFILLFFFVFLFFFRRMFFFLGDSLLLGRRRFLRFFFLLGRAVNKVNGRANNVVGVASAVRLFGDCLGDDLV